MCIEQAIEKSYDLDGKVTMKKLVIIPLGSNSRDNSHSMGHQSLRSLELPKILPPGNASRIAEQILSPISDSNGNLMSSPSLPAASPTTPSAGINIDQNVTISEKKNENIHHES